MKLIFLKAIVLFVLTSYFTEMVFALEIISPNEGQVVYQGDRLNVIVKPDPGETWEEVLLSIFPMSYNIFKGIYEEEIEIPIDSIGNFDFRVFAYDKSGKKVKLTRNLLVKMPLNVVLQSIDVYPDYIVLEKLPPESNPDDIKAFGTRKFKVAGMYSDGVRRKHISGNTFTSTNEKIVTVSPEGTVTAQDLGEAKITVTNGKFSVEVKVIVDPYKE